MRVNCICILQITHKKIYDYFITLGPNPNPKARNTPSRHDELEATKA